MTDVATQTSYDDDDDHDQDDQDHDHDHADDDEIQMFDEKKDADDFEESVLEIVDQYLETHLVNYSDPHFTETLCEDIYEIMRALFSGEDEENDEPIHYDTVIEIAESCVTFLYTVYEIPPRYEITDTTTTIRSWPIQNKQQQSLLEKIENLRKIPQPQQRTPEWYAFRQEIITASNIWKIFASDAQFNSLVYEKCQPMKMYSSSTNTNSPMHWGVKYEPLTSMIYQRRNQTLLEEFGCIRHPQYPWIGASPDGINVSVENPHLLGRMIEIKNIVNREIDGNPSVAYWIQMQLQMETCDLEECDFVETQFKEYESAVEFWDSLTTQDQDNDKDDPPQEKGIILMFVDSQTYSVKYEYMPLDINLTPRLTDHWIFSTISRIEKEMESYQHQKTIYWYLDIYSCVLVKRNRRWFEAASPIIENAWKTIEKERVEGHAHRAPKTREGKRISKTLLLEVVKMDADSTEV